MLVNCVGRDWSTPVGEQVLVAPVPNEPIEAPLAPPLILHTLVSKQNEWFGRLTAFATSPERHEVCLCARVRLTRQCRYAPVCALASLVVAGKVCEEDSVDSVEHMLHAIRAPYSRHELLRMELCLLEKMQWNLGAPTAHRFLQVLVYTFTPSTLALACLANTLVGTAGVHRQDTVRSTISWLRHLVQIRADDLSACQKRIGAVHQQHKTCKPGRCARKRRRRLNSKGSDVSVASDALKQRRHQSAGSRRQRTLVEHDANFADAFQLLYAV
ncbi:unnamed protein product [Sphagnum balticum]